MMDKTPDSLRAFQKLTRDYALQGKNIVLQAPTGAGKTQAAIQPGLMGFERETGAYPQQMIYGTPMRSLTNSFLDLYQNIARSRLKWLNNEWQPTIQTGEQPEDNLFTGQIIFATVDQMLASFLGIPYGVRSSLDNINSGAFMGSYLVFDEFHLYPTQQMMLTVIAMLKLVEGISRFTLMTATSSRVLLNALEQHLGATIIADAPDTSVTEGLFSDIEHLKDQNRIWSAHEEPLNGQHVKAALDDFETVLCVCNTVDRAQTVYRELMKSGIPADVDYKLLHSRFYQADRQHNERAVLSWLGKKNDESYTPQDGKRKVIIATQVVEVGLDISAQVLLTEAAPASSLIQRAGRCARGGGVGYVRVHQPPADENNQPNYAPYLDDGLLEVCQRTWASLTSDDFGNGLGVTLRYEGEQKLINEAHAEHDKALVDGLGKKIETRIDEIIGCMRSHDRGKVPSLIRKNSSTRLYIKADLKHSDLTERHYELDGFSVSQGRIAREMEAYQETVQADYYIAAGQVMTTEETEADFQSKPQYKWELLREPKDVWGNWLFAVHPAAISYDLECGLSWQPEANNPAQESPKVPRKPYEPIAYDPDTYVQHISGLMQAYEKKNSAKGYPLSLREMYHYALMQTARRIDPQITWETLDRYIRLMLALHDVGKLNQTWQDWAQARHKLFTEYYPDAAASVPADGTPLAHTVKGKQKFSTEADHEAFEADFFKRFRGKRGPHAVESAEAARSIIMYVVGNDPRWYGIISTAICHHHTPSADSIRDQFVLVRNGRQAIIEGLAACGFDPAEAEHLGSLANDNFRLPAKILRNGISTTLPQYSNFFSGFMYLLFVRLLRLADQRSSEYIHG